LYWIGTVGFVSPGMTLTAGGWFVNPLFGAYVGAGGKGGNPPAGGWLGGRGPGDGGAYPSGAGCVEIGGIAVTPGTCTVGTGDVPGMTGFGFITSAEVERLVTPGTRVAAGSTPEMAVFGFRLSTFGVPTVGAFGGVSWLGRSG
jgi:hypothetical protein